MKGKKKWLIVAPLAVTAVVEVLAQADIVPPVVLPVVQSLAQVLAGLFAALGLNAS